MDVLNNPSLTCFKNQAPVAQLDRVPGYEPGGRRFESVRARQNTKPSKFGGFFVLHVPKGHGTAD